MPNTRLAFLFLRYTANTCSEVERTEFLIMVSDHAFKNELNTLMDEVWLTMDGSEELTQFQSDRILSEIPIAQSHRMSHSGSKQHLNWKLGIAASVFVCIMLGGLMYLQRSGMVPFQNAMATASLGDRDTQAHQFIKLPDNSTVILNAGSTLQYPDSFDESNNREVTLTGEGYFDIQHDASKPFIVHTGKLKTTVLGTAFNIKAYAEEKNITVTVLRGKVKVEEGEQIYGIITPNQQIIFDTHELVTEQQVVDGHQIISWMDKDVFFDDITLEEAAIELERRFNTKIIFANARIKECRFTMTFVKGENLQQIMRVICEFNMATFKKEDGKIIISGNGC